MSVKSAVNVVLCPRCTIKTVNLRSLIRHIGIRHAYEHNFSITCGIDGCRTFFRLFSSFRRHVYRRHRNVILPESRDLSTDCMQTSDCDDNDVDNNIDCDISANAVDGLDETDIASGESDIVKSLGLFCLKLKEQYGASETVVSNVVTDVLQVMKQVQTSHQQQILTELRKTGFNITTNSEVAALLTKTSPTYEACEASLGTSWKRFHFYADNMPLVLPQQINLGTNEVGKVDVVAFVSVAKVLEKWFTATDVASVISNAGNLDTTMLTDFFDGQLAAQYPDTFGKNFLQILLYCDDFEVANPLGSKRGVHKLLAFYFTLLNLPIKHRSKLENMHLTLLTKSSNVTKYGLDAVLAPLIDDLNLLQDSGICIKHNGEIHHFTARIAFICADNLAANKLAGFTQNFSRGRICRFCMASREDISNLHLESQCKLRTTEIHNAQLSSVLADRSLSSVYGVVTSCPLSCLLDFDVTLAFAPDVMHDLLEGVVPLTAKQVLQAAIVAGCASLQDINNQMLHMPIKYGRNRYMPPPLTASSINGDSVISGTASERWCLLRILPFLLSKIPDETYWETYLNLREICDIVFAKRLPKTCIAYLSVCISNFLQNFHEAFPDVNMTPKMHFLVHYPRYLELIGPLTGVWTMRFEGKHCPLKEDAQKIRNWRNVTMSLARNHQLKQCYVFAAQTAFLCELQTSGTYKVKISNMHSALATIIAQYIPVTEDEIWQSNSVSNGTVTIKCNCTYPLKFSELELPLFFIVCKIFQFNHAVYFCGKSIVISHFDRQRWAYVGKKSGRWKVVHCIETSLEEVFLDSHDVAVYEMQDDLLVVPQYGLFYDD